MQIAPGTLISTRALLFDMDGTLVDSEPLWFEAEIEVIDDPARIAAAYERYTAIERRGWKAGAEIGIWSDARFHAFYRELLPLLAAPPALEFAPAA